MTQTNISYVTSKVPEEPVEPCSRDDDNKLGANLSYIYYFMFVFSVITNLLVLVVIHRFERLTTVINILLVNLVTSSLILMSSLPFQAASMQTFDWTFGSAMCKTQTSSQTLQSNCLHFGTGALLDSERLSESLPEAAVKHKI
ncbi:C-C chemokine receptor type 1-like [Poecilia reticulata]|uniref:C-C chemokine receptor type 1-like n=1 Tax=Poecilia reticulata TaxID=8081 RepID=UPI0004A2AEAB|nr:PREDICTED: C-C chemokine receptor type 1-like [Poecilia reticulata]